MQEVIMKMFQILENLRPQIIRSISALPQRPKKAAQLRDAVPAPLSLS